MIQVDVDGIRIDVIQNHIIFAPKMFNFKIILVISIFENAVASKVFTFTFLCAISLRAPVGEIRRPSDGVEDVKSPLCGTGNLWAYDSDGSWWVHINSVIAILPKYNSSHFSTCSNIGLNLQYNVIIPLKTDYQK